MFRWFLTSPLLLLSLVALSMTGCGESDVDDSVVLEQRAKFLLDTEPDGPLAVDVVRERVEKSSSGDAGGGEQVVLVGKIGGVPEPWSKGRAGFVVIDPAADHDTENCADADCPHCARHRAREQLKATALVEFVEGGRVVPIDAKRLFRVKEGQVVVIRGKARLNEDNLVIEADGLYVRE
jgi:hypothetical protein